MNLLEVCCGNPESVAAAVAGGAPRIELCSHLEVDGLTPDWEVLRAVRHQYPTLRIHVLIRPRAGDFHYTVKEIDRMARDIETALDLGADGVVSGALSAKGDVDNSPMLDLTCAASEWGTFHDKEPAFTFHRAFDRVRSPFDALETIIMLGCDRILTSGQAPTAAEGTDLLRELQLRAGGELLILPGGGVTPPNARRILELSGCREIHASASKNLPDGRKVTSARKVSQIMDAIR